LSAHPLHHGRMKDANCRIQHEWFAQVLEAKNCKTQIVDEMFGVLRSFFVVARQSRNQESAQSTAVFENLVLDTPTATVRLRLVPATQLDVRSKSIKSESKRQSLCSDDWLESPFMKNMPSNGLSNSHYDSLSTFFVDLRLVFLRFMQDWGLLRGKMSRKESR
jgi:hypothetical protein